MGACLGRITRSLKALSGVILGFLEAFIRTDGPDLKRRDTMAQ